MKHVHIFGTWLHRRVYDSRRCLFPRRKLCAEPDPWSCTAKLMDVEIVTQTRQVGCSLSQATRPKAIRHIPRKFSRPTYCGEVCLTPLHAASLGPSSTDKTLERRSRHAARHNTCYSSCRVRIPYPTVRTDGLCATLCQQLLECCVILVLTINRCKSQLCTAKMSRHFLHVRKCQNFLDRCSSRRCLIHWRGHLHRSARGQSPSSGLRCHILTSVSRL